MSGFYRVVHVGHSSVLDIVMALSNDVFPTCKDCGSEVRYEKITKQNILERTFEVTTTALQPKRDPPAVGGYTGAVYAFAPGEAVPRTAVYAINHYQHRLPHIAVITEGSLFPTCKQCGNRVRFALVSSSPILSDKDFTSPEPNAA